MFLHTWIAAISAAFIRKTNRLILACPQIFTAYSTLFFVFVACFMCSIGYTKSVAPRHLNQYPDVLAVTGRNPTNRTVRRPSKDGQGTYAVRRKYADMQGDRTDIKNMFVVSPGNNLEITSQSGYVKTVFCGYCDRG